MESVPLLPKAKVLPNLDVLPLIREVFQDELQAAVPSKKFSRTVVTSLQYEKTEEEEKETYRSVDYLENLTKRKDNLIDYAQNVLEAYAQHENYLDGIRKAERNIFETHASYLKRELTLLENQPIQDLLKLKRQPLFKALDLNYVNKYKLLQGEAGLPPLYKAKSDFRVKNFQTWRKRLQSISQDSLIMNYLNRTPAPFVDLTSEECFQLKREVPVPVSKKSRRSRTKKLKIKEREMEIFRSEPKIVFFTNYKIGDVYVAEIRVKNVSTKGVKFQVKPTSSDSPFNVRLDPINTRIVYPGLGFHLTVEFIPTSLDNAAEDIYVVIEGGHRLLIPLVAYLEPPILKTHKDINEYTRLTTEKIASSYIECGSCFTGDSNVTKLRFCCYRGSGEFFIMSSENWNRSYVNTMTADNLLEIPPFRVYPVFFKIERNEEIDLFVEFLPKNSGTHVENIVIACDNGEVRSLDILGDAVGWHSYFFSFQESMLKELSVDKDDDLKVKYYLDFDDTTPSGKVERVFCISNNSNMAFEFQWKIREANISSKQDKYLKLSKYQVKIDPENGTFAPNSIYEFLVTVSFNNAEIGEYRMVLSLYVLNLPYQCIEEDNTIIQPTGLVRNLYSQSLYGEEEYTIPSPELMSLQGTYESLQESIKSYVEYQTKAQAAPKYDFCRTHCIPNPGLCAKPLKKSKTFFNIGENVDEDGQNCACRTKQSEGESRSDSCVSNIKEEKVIEASVPKNEVIWDFVDILVDEIELWVEVGPTRVILQPTTVEFCSPLRVNDPPVFKQVRITNYTRSSVTCIWVVSNLIDYDSDSAAKQNKSKVSVSLLFDKKQNEDHVKQKDAKVTSQSSKTNKTFDDKSSRTETGEGSKACKLFVEPKGTFTVPGMGDRTCEIGVYALKAGKIQEELTLVVNGGDLILKLMVSATATRKIFTTSPQILDFGVLKQGTRHTKEYKIINESPFPFHWRVNQFKFNFNEEKFLNPTEISDEGSVKREEGMLPNKGCMSAEPYYMNAKVPGIRCSLMEIQPVNPVPESCTNQYILILGDVKVPALTLNSPRFENAILAPARMMYVGQKITTSVTLTNTGNVETFFTWGRPFGCHSRKIKVEISPKSCLLKKQKKLVLQIDLTPLEKGIINHCYIPCFFCRSSEPLILSVVGLAENINVTFEIIDYPLQIHADVNNFLKSPFYHTVLRVPWPVHSYDPNLGLTHIGEEAILNMKCECFDVEEEANRVFGFEFDPSFSKELFPGSTDVSGNAEKKLFTTPVHDERENKEFISSELSSVDKKNDTLTEYQSKESYYEALQFLIFELEFLNTPFRTPILRQFVIRNETPVPTSFTITVLHYGVPQNTSENKVVSIMNRVLGYTKDDFKSRLPKEQPLLITVDPEEGELLGFDACCINVYAYGNTWGEYRDYLLCHVKGMETFHLKVLVQIVGHPIWFPMLESHGQLKPSLRFQPQSYVSEPTLKQIRVVNRSAIPLTIAWIVYLNETLPKKEETEENYTLTPGSNAPIDSVYSGQESSKSTKVYLPKNTSDALFRFKTPDVGECSQKSTVYDSYAKTESEIDRDETQDFGEADKSYRSIVVPPLSEEAKSEIQIFPTYGRPNIQIFQVFPKESYFEPFEEKRITMTFNPSLCKPKAFSQEFQGVLTGCVKLKPEHESATDLYFRRCGVNFVSELMDIKAAIETPLVSFEILKGDLQFFVDANEVVKSPQKQFSITRKFLFKNNNQSWVPLKIEVIPGIVFHVNTINTLDKTYQKYDSEEHCIKIEPGQPFEVELECLATYKDVIYAYEQLKQNRKKDEPSATSEDTKLPKWSKNADKADNEPWHMYFESLVHKTPTCTENTFGHRDSLQLNQNRMSLKSSDLACRDLFDYRDYFAEAEGEYLELSTRAEELIPCKTAKLPHHTIIIEERVSFVQTGLITQTLNLELHLSFPAVRVTPKCLDFGNVYIGESAIRYFSIVNLTGIPTEFKVKTSCTTEDFFADPITGSVPSTNYKSDIGRTITIVFKPSRPGYLKGLFQIFCNMDMQFDYHELTVSGFGTWNERYRSPRVETYHKLQGPYSNLKR